MSCLKASCGNLLKHIEVQNMHRAAFISLRTCDHWDNFVCNVQLFFLHSTVVLWNKLHVHIFVWRVFLFVKSWLVSFQHPHEGWTFSHHIKHCILYGSWRSCAHNTTVPQFVLIILCRYSCMLCLSPNFSRVQMVKVGIHCTMQRFKLTVLLIKEIRTFRIYNPQWHVSQNST